MSQRKFPVVALGASAGGLEALIDFFQPLPRNPGMAFLVAVHLAPEHESQLPHILSQHAKLSVLQAVHGARVAPGHVYVIPPGKDLSIARGRLRLTEREEGRKPIDVLFSALARDQGARAVGIVLSGEGSDGAQGLLDIRAAGGLTIAQDEATAKHPSMPAAAVAAGAVERVLPPRRMARELPQLLRRGRGAARKKASRAPRTEQEALARICALVASAAGIDFARYKQTTILRRVTRRMVLRGFTTVRSYLSHLESSPAEVRALHDELLIHVTGFFRDPRAYKILAAKIYPALLARRSAKDPVRIWVAGCATGEEVYSHAINLLEYLRETKTQAQIQLFATDVDPGVLDKARAGLYSDKIAKDVPPERLRRYFVKTKSGYRIQKSVRELCVFARQDLVKDPPFSSIDLLSCRNVLIYLGASLQRRALPIMHYALRPGGFLILGNSETVGECSERFAVVSPKANIYAKRPARLPLPEGVLARAKPLEISAPPRAFAAAAPPAERGAAPLERQVERVLLEQYAPPAVVVDGALNVVQTHGHTGPFLELPPGKVSVNMLRMIRAELATSLRLAFSEARKRRARARKGPVALTVEGRRVEVRVEVAPLPGEDGERYYLVLFRASAAAPGAGRPRSGSRREMQQLRQEVASAREYLRLTVQDQEAATQEIKSAHEEILSSNEELQSMNEELETAKEELQSTNEEMATVNEELTLRNRELKTANDDLANLIASSQIPILMLDNDLKIRRLTPPAEKALHLSAADVGRSISDVKLDIEAPFLEKELAAVVGSARTRELEVRDRKGRWYSMWLRPNRTVEGRAPEGIVVSLVDMTEKRNSLAALKESRDYAESIVDTIKESLLVLDSELRVRRANRSFCKAFGVSLKEVKGRLFFELGAGRWKSPKLESLLKALLDKGRAFTDWETTVEAPPKRRRRTLALSGRLLSRGPGKGRAALLIIEDVTARKQATEIEALRKSEAQQRGFVANVSHELMTPIALIKGYAETMAGGSVQAGHDRARFSRVIELSRLESGRKRLDKELVLLRPFALQFIRTIRPVAARQRVSIRAKVPAGLEVSMNKAELAQILQNLCENAIKYNRRGGSVTIEARREERRARVAVADTGIGIPRKDLSRIFDRFHRTDGARARGVRGTGLGLSIVRTIVRRHGGRIWAQSSPGKGTTFFFTVPLT